MPDLIRRKPTMTFQFLLFAGLALLSNLVCAKDYFQNGNEALRAGHYHQAYGFWIGHALKGSVDFQEATGLLMLGEHADQLKLGAGVADQGLKFLYLAAAGGKISAMQRIARAADTGSLGLEKSSAVAICWDNAAEGRASIWQCVWLTGFRHSAARPKCSDLVNAGPLELNRSSGVERARLCRANETLALMMPGLPPGEEERLRVEEYRKNGIEYMNTGDMYEEKFEAFRTGFNQTMIRKITLRKGANIFLEIDKAVNTAFENNKKNK